MKNTILGKPLEFGNTDQIMFLQNAEQEMNEMIEFGREINNDFVAVDVRFAIEFYCIQCQTKINGDQADVCNVDVSNSIEQIIEDYKLTCSCCKCEYKAENGLITLVKNPKHPERVTTLNN